MRRLFPGCHVTAPDGRRMTVTRIDVVDGILVVHWEPTVVLARAA